MNISTEITHLFESTAKFDKDGLCLTLYKAKERGY